MSNKIQEIIDNLKPDLKKIDQIILDFSVGKSPLIKEIAHHLISSGGKRIRPILLILAAKLCDEKSENYHNLSAAVEMIHSATLLHDDVVDESTVRRGKKTANALWDNKASILVGDYLFSVAFQLMVTSKNLTVLDLLAKTSSIMADGEVMQLENSQNIDITQEKYLEIIFSKTAVLFSAACESGALINSDETNKIRALKEFGKNLGIVFQIIDDILDYVSQEKDLGKDIGNDFYEGKITLPIILLFSLANDNDKKIIKNLFEESLMSKGKNENNFAEILDLLAKYKALEASFNLAEKYKNLAIKNLEIFSDSIYKQYLLEILNYSSQRKS